MEWQRLLQPENLEFMRRHGDADVAALALKKPPAGIANYPLLLSQIKARQKARKKLPAWFLEDANVILPGADIVEQASSQATALYKAGLFEGGSFIDITAGLGVDSWAFAGRFEQGICVEQDGMACEILAHNFKALGCGNLNVIHARAEDFIHDMPDVDLVYIDPQRRDQNQKGKFFLDDCSPDVLKILPILKLKSKMILLKASPMLDIVAAVKALGGVQHVHVVEYAGDCKEVLYLMGTEGNQVDNFPVTSASLNDDGSVRVKFSFDMQEERSALAPLSMPLSYLYEPGPAFIKAGGYNMLAIKHHLNKLHPDTHLYTGENLVSDFPGRVFEIRGVYPVRAGAFPLSKANLTLRNFPGTTDELRKKLKIRDGGADTLFACTLMNSDKALIHGVKV